MTEEKTVYFEKIGPENTERALALAVAAAREMGIRNIILASTAGNTALALTGAEGLNVTVVTHAYGQKEPGGNPMSEETRAALKAKGYNLVTAAHALSGVERSMSTTFHGVYPAEIIAYTLRMFGAGTKVCVEIAAMAADAGIVRAGEEVIAVGGSGAGADTVLVLKPEVSSRILQTRVEKVICKPLL